MRKMITILLVRRADIDSCCLSLCAVYTLMEKQLILQLYYVCIARYVSHHNNYEIKDVLSYVIDEIIIE